MNYERLIKIFTGKFLITFIWLWVSLLTTTHGQTIDISVLTGGVAASPMQGGSTNQAILGFEFAKGGGATTVTDITITLSSTPTGKFTNPRLYESSGNNIFEGIGTETFRANGTFNGNTIEFTGAPLLSFAAGNDTDSYFIVVDIDDNVDGATAAIQPSLTSGNVASGATVTGSATGTDYSFTALTTTIGSLNAGANNVAASPLVASSTGQAIFGFSLQSNGTQTVTGINVQFSSTPVGKITGYSLIPSADADFATPNSPAIAGLTFTPSATQVAITGLNESITSTIKNYFLVVNVDGGVSGATADLQASIASTDVVVSGGYKTGSATGVDYSFEELTTTITQIAGGIAASPLASNAATQAILGFSVVSNGNPNLTALTIELTSNANGKFSAAQLYESANNSFGGDAEIVDPGGYTTTLTNAVPFRIQFTNLSQTLSSTTRYYFVVVNVAPTVDATTASIQPSFSSANVTLSGTGTVTVTGEPITGTNYSFVDNSPPLTTALTPPDNQTGVTVLLNQLVMTFNEQVNNIGTGGDNNNNIRLYASSGDVLIETIDPTSPGRVTISGAGNNVVTISLTTALQENTQYYVQVGNNVLEDNSGNNYAGISSTTGWNFTIENVPAITNVSPTSTCIGNPVTLTGQRFAGTGSTPPVNKPEVRVGGQLVPSVDVTSFNATQIIFNLPSNAVTGTITVKNMDNQLTSAASGQTLTVKPAIDTSLPTTTSVPPSVGTNFDILVGGATQSTVSYRVQRPNLTFTGAQTGDGGQLSFGTFSHGSPGTYTYRIEASSSNCTTVFLNDVVVVIAELTADAGPDRDLCESQSTILGGNPPGFGGTGFISYSWTSSPAGFSSNSPNPSVSPTVTTTYTLTVSDNTGATDNSSVTVTVFPTPVVSFQPVPPDTDIRTSYVLEDRYYELNGSPSQLISDGAIFSGPGVVAISDSNKYYFNPQLAGVSNSHTITYTYYDGNCSNSTTISFNVSSSTITGLQPFYCASELQSGNLEPSASTMNLISTYYPGYTFSRLRFYNGLYYDPPIEPLFKPDPINNPNRYRLDIQKLIANFGIGGYYIDVFATNGITEVLITWQYFRTVPLGVAPEIIETSTLIPLNEKFIACSDATPVNLGSSIADYTITSFDITTGQSSAISGNQFIPANVNFGGGVELPLDITMNYEDYNGCASSVTRNIAAVKKPVAPDAPDVEYCQFAFPPFPIYASGYGDNFLWYATDPSAGNVSAIDRGPIFTTHGIDGQLATQQTYYVTQTYRTCEGDPEPTVIRIKPAPSANFTLPTICVDREFTLEGPLDMTDPNDPKDYTTYDWTFGDAVASGRTVSHTYTAVNQYTITLSITSAENCTNKSSQDVTPGFNPIPDFTFNQVCEGDDTQFVATSNITVAQYAWDFGDGTIISPGNVAGNVPPPNQGTYVEPQHEFVSGTGVYQVTVTAFTGSGCYDSLTKEVGILEYRTFTTDNPYQMQDLDAGKGFWTVEDVNGNSSWEFAVPTTPLLNQAEEAWVTNATGLYSSDERSYLNSPCLNISGITKPVFSLNFRYSTQLQSDGAVLEFSKDGGLNWAALGSINSGLEWFNSTFFGNIGNSTLGWSGTDSTAAYTFGKQAIDNVPGLTTPADRQKLRFRFAWASNNNGEFEGFALNRVTIESRNRNLLVENFTNSSAGGYAAGNTAFTDISDTEAVKLQYHLSFPGTDAINTVNPQDPHARSAFYGINNSATLIPRGYVDGYSNGSLAAPWDDDYRSKRSLATSPLEIEINTTASANPDELSFSVVVDPIVNLDALNAEPVLYAAIIEESVGNNAFVVRKMLPHAAGIQLTMPILATDDPIENDFVWKPESPGFVKDKIALVAFVQDQVTKEVYQAAILRASAINQAHIPDPSLITSLEDPAFADKIQVYPNPANEEVNVVLPAPVSVAAPVQLMDAQGRILYEGSFNAGEQQKLIPVADFAGGIYILQISTKENMARKKVMVAHKGN
jgi:hypothetical protein